MRVDGRRNHGPDPHIQHVSLLQVVLLLRSLKVRLPLAWHHGTESLFLGTVCFGVSALDHSSLHVASRYSSKYSRRMG